MNAIPVRPVPTRAWTHMHGAAVAGAGAAGVAASLLAAHNAGGIAGAGLALLMVAIAVIDARHFIIPDELNIAALGLALIYAGTQNGGIEATALAVIRGAFLSLTFLGLRIAYRALRKRDGIGLGDVKLAGVAGAWLSWQTMPIAVQIAALAALITYAMHRYVTGHALQMTHRLPFGLFFAPAIWLGWLMQALELAPS